MQIRARDARLRLRSPWSWPELSRKERQDLNTIALVSRQVWLARLRLPESGAVRCASAVFVLSVTG